MRRGTFSYFEFFSPQDKQQSVYFEQKIVWTRALFVIFTSFSVFLLPLPLQAVDKPLEIEITTVWGDNQTFEQGDIVQYLISANQKAYFLLLYEDAKGNLLQILPSKQFGDGFFNPGNYYIFPPNEAKFTFLVAPPYGKEKMRLYASQVMFPNIPSKRFINGMKYYSTQNKSQIIQQLDNFANAKSEVLITTSEK